MLRIGYSIHVSEGTESKDAERADSESNDAERVENKGDESAGSKDAESAQSKDAESAESMEAESDESKGGVSAESKETESNDSEGAEIKDAESVDSERAENKDAESAEGKEAESDESKGDEREGESKGDDKVDVKQARLEIAGPDAIAVDVRSEEEWGKGHIAGAIHLPEGDPEKAAKPLEEGARLLVLAEKGKAAASAAAELREKGYDAAAIDGSMKDWMSEDYAVQPTDDPDEDTELGRN